MRYDDIPYVGHPVPYASPQALALAARLHGGPRASLEAARVLEIGCGDGAHLLPLAFHHPDWDFVGLDSSESAIGRARAGAEAVGATNVRFEVGDLADASFEPESFEYVIAHGVYSWIDAERRAALRRLMRGALTPSGLAYVCFNAQPGWGVRGRVRDQLRGLDVEGARARATALLGCLEGGTGAWGMQLAHELERVVDAEAGYLAHEYLAPHNDAFWLHEVVADFERENLRFAGDAQAQFPEGWVTPELRARVAPLASSVVERTELLDLLGYRQLRAVVFARDDAAFEEPAGETILDEAGLVGVLRSQSDPFDLTPGVEEPFVGPQGEVRVGSGIGKMALLIMGARYPDAFSFGELLEQAAGALAERGYVPDLEQAPSLRNGLMQLVDHRLLELRLGRRTVRTEPGDQPTASVLARWEAPRRGALTTPIHTSLPLDPVDRAIVVQLDGTVDLDEVAGALTGDVLAGRLELEGAPSGALRIEPLLRSRAEALTAQLGWWGLAE